MPPQASSRTLIITADDTTGALESAAGLADVGWASTVVPLASASDLDGAADRTSVVVDVRSRHDEPTVAAGKLAATLVQLPSLRAHKIDSTLRGNWPDEIAAAVTSGRRVLLLPSYPQAGRVCVDGVVTEHGVPVDQTAHGVDVRSPVRTSRPATLLPGAVELPTAAHVADWLAGAGRVAVADAGDDRQLSDVVSLACTNDDVLIVGTAAVMAAIARFIDGGTGSRPARAVPTIVPPVLVVCGSLHATSRQQVEALAFAGAVIGSADSERSSAVSVLTSPNDREGDPLVVARSLAERAHQLVRASRPSTVVLLGGDTAEAFIGDRVVDVFGSIGVGIAVGAVEIDGRSVTLVAKPGAFGSANTLVDLMGAALHGTDT